MIVEIDENLTTRETTKSTNIKFTTVNNKDGDFEEGEIDEEMPTRTETDLVKNLSYKKSLMNKRKIILKKEGDIFKN